MIRALAIAALLIAGICPAARAAQCGAGTKPVINIVASESEPRFDYSLSQEQLGKMQGNNGVSQDSVYDLTVNAMSVGTMKVVHNLKFITQTMPDKQVCVHVSQVNVNIHVDPVIYIASELRGAACEYKEYLIHEMKHVEADRALVEDYKAVIVRNMDFAFPETADYDAGPLPPSLTKDARQSLSENVAGVLQATVDSMLRERQARQREIDNTDEYIRLSRVCPEDGPGVKAELRAH